MISISPPPDSNGTLSPRLIQIVNLAAEGLTDKEIARKLGVSTSTVDFHWKRLRAMYELGTRTGIVVRVLRQMNDYSVDSVQLAN